jgi:hypothetical protein
MNKITLTFEAESFDELRDKIINAAKSMGYVPEQSELNLEVQTPKKKAKQSKAEDVAPVLATHEAVSSEKVTKEKLKDALTEVSNKKGVEIARDVLSRFGCLRLSEIKEPDYEKFLSVCEQEVGS